MENNYPIHFDFGSLEGTFLVSGGERDLLRAKVAKTIPEAVKLSGLIPEGDDDYLIVARSLLSKGYYRFCDEWGDVYIYFLPDHDRLVDKMTAVAKDVSKEGVLKKIKGMDLLDYCSQKMLREMVKAGIPGEFIQDVCDRILTLGELHVG